jgi:hypothetical protein
MLVRPILACVAISAFLHFVAAGESDCDGILFSEDFDASIQSGFLEQALKHEAISLAENAGPDGSNAIRVAYVGFERGSKRVVSKYPLTTPVKQATLSYDVCFEQDFRFVLSGKLHGLGPRVPVTGGRPRSPEKWSARVNFKKDGHCATYLYDQTLDKTYGIGETSANPVFKKGEWHRVALELTLNDPGKSNGSARILIDGRQAVLSEGICFRGIGGQDTDIQLFLFSTFHGGSSPKYTPVDEEGKPTTVHALFDNFRVIKGIRTP